MQPGPAPEPAIAELPPIDHSRLATARWLKRFEGSHPAVMEEIAAFYGRRIDLASDQLRRDLSASERRMQRKLWPDRNYVGALRRYLFRRDCKIVKG